jgi:hypothetical protein
MHRHQLVNRRTKALLALFVLVAVGAIVGSTQTGSAAVTAAPANTSPPTIAGTATEGVTLNASPGTWTATNPTFTYRWLRCDKKGNRCEFSGGSTTQTTHVIVHSEVGHTIRVEVTATDTGGSTSARSLATAVVLTAPSTTTTTATTPGVSASGCPTGTGPIVIKDLTPPARLSLDGQSISPSVIGRSPGQLTVRIHVSACGGRTVQGAMVYVTAVPFNQFSIPAEVATGADGWATLTMAQQAGYPASTRQQLLAVFVRASKPGDPALAGVSSRRLISFPVNLNR